MGFGTRRSRKTVYCRLFSIFFLLLAPIILNAGSFALNRFIRFHHLSIENGLSQSSVLCILHDQKGYIWFGTQDGLNRYDGVSVKVFKKDSNQPDVISNNYIRCISEAADRRLWIGTHGGGVNCYSPATETFTHYRHTPGKPDSLSNDNVSAILATPSGIIWIGTWGGGLNRLDPATGTFTHYKYRQGFNDGPVHNTVTALCPDAEGRLWIGTHGGGASCFDPITEKFIHFTHRKDDDAGLSHNAVSEIICTPAGTVWIGTLGGGLNRLSRNEAGFTHLTHNPKDPNSLSNNYIEALYQDRRGILWIGTRGGGLNAYDEKTGQFGRHTKQETLPESLGADYIHSITEDRYGVLWVGTQGAGADRFDNNPVKFLHYRKENPPPHGLSDDSISAVLEDDDGTLWVGTLDKGLNHLNRQTGNVTWYHNQPNNPASLSANGITCLLNDHKKRLWVGTDGGGLNCFNRKTKTFSRYLPDRQNPNAIIHSEISALHEDRRHRVWIGTRGGGLDMFDETNHTFHHYHHTATNPQGLNDNFIRVIISDAHEGMWIGTQNGGLNHLNLTTGLFTHYRHSAANTDGISSDFILSLFLAPNGTLWIGTQSDGLCGFNPDTGNVTHFTSQNGLPNNTIYSIMQDKKGHLWLSTNKGLVCFDTEKRLFKTYTVDDGLQSNEFNSNSHYLSKRSSEMFFGGVKGFNAFFPERVEDNPIVPDMAITGFRLFNRPVPIGRPHNGRIILEKAVGESDSITLSYRENSISFDLAPMHYVAPASNLCSYKLENFEEKWNDIGTRRSATYTNLPPGTYVFKVRGANHDGLWSKPAPGVTITIHGPFWSTPWFRVLAVLTAILIFLLSHRIRSTHLKKRYAQLEESNRTLNEQIIERLLAEKELKEAKDAAEAANKAKSIFITNMSHEVRTPLNAILGFTGLMEKKVADQTQKQYLASIHAGAKDLLELFGDMLDLSRLESGGITIKPTPTDIHSLMNEVEFVFSRSAGDKGLVFQHHLECDFPGLIMMDDTRVRQVLFNLLRNSIKFTSQGYVIVKCRCTPGRQNGLSQPEPPPFPSTCRQLPSQPHHADVVFEVEDTGIGIPKDKLELIFQEFKQLDERSSRMHEGLGLGLALVSRLIRMMKGEITVESEVGRGSVFKILLKNLPVVCCSKTEPEKPMALNKEEPPKRREPQVPPPPPTLFSLETKLNLRRLHHILKTEMEERWSHLQKAFVFDEIESFAHEMKQLGDQYSWSALHRWAETLAAEVECFDMENLPKTLARFPELLEQLKDAVQ